MRRRHCKHTSQPDIKSLSFSNQVSSSSENCHYLAKSQLRNRTCLLETELSGSVDYSTFLEVLNLQKCSLAAVAQG